MNSSSEVKNTPKINAQSVKEPSRKWHRYYYRVWCEIIPGQNDYSKMYKSKKRIETYLPTERDVGIANVYVTQSEKINKKQSRKQFKIWIVEMWVLDLK